MDIVKRLRGKKERVEIPCPDNIKGCAVLHFRLEVNPDCAEAADEIERLRKQLEMSEQRFATLKEAYDKNRRRNIQLYGSKALREKE